MAYSSREEVEERYTWDLTSMFASEEAFEAALKDAQNLPERCAAFQGTVSTSTEGLLAFLRFDDEADIALSKLHNYASRKSDEDTRDSRWQDLSNQTLSLYIAVSGASAWFTPELLSVDEAKMAEFYAAKPELELYRRALDRIFARREHTLSPAEEKLLAAAQEMATQPGNIFSLMNDADLTFGPALDAQGAEHEVTHGSYIPLMMQPDRTLRESAFKQMYAQYGAFRNTFAATLGAQTKQLKFFADARKYESSLAYCLDGNEVPPSVYTNLIDAIHENLGALHKYVKLRRSLLGVEELHYWDLYVPVIPNAEMTFTYEEACDLVLEALAPMGEEYLALVRRGLEERWVDVYETPGKRSGAYSAGGFGMHPVILLNFQGTLDDVYTLIHEMGHSIHTYLSCETQPSCYSDYVIFVAEVASTVNEALLTQHLLAKAQDKRRRAYILNHFLEQFRGTLYRQGMFAEFELQANELTAQGASLTADALCEAYAELNRRYFGDAIEADEEIALEWARIPHFYYQYYVYQYATGYAAAIALSQRILNEDPSALTDYLGFLKGGCSKPPIELLKGAGVDMTTPEPVNQALALFDSLVDEMADLVKELD